MEDIEGLQLILFCIPPEKTHYYTCSCINLILPIKNADRCSSHFVQEIRAISVIVSPCFPVIPNLNSILSGCSSTLQCNCLILRFVIIQVPNINLLITESPISKDIILNKYDANYMTQLLAKQPDKNKAASTCAVTSFRKH